MQDDLLRRRRRRRRHETLQSIQLFDSAPLNLFTLQIRRGSEEKTIASLYNDNSDLLNIVQ